MFEPNQYRELCSELHVSEEKLEEVIQMTEQEKKRKFHRPMRLGLVGRRRGRHAGGNGERRQF